MKLYHGDCLEELKKLEDNSVDAVITDPPYGLSNTKPQQVADVLRAWVTGDTESVPAKRGGFMGKDWDSFVPPPAVWEECMRVLKPGGHMAVFAGARTQDLMGLSIRLAGFEIRDTLGWVYGSGFPKSHNISKAIDKATAAECEEIATSEAQQWDGWGTALKPAIEPIILARKPLDGTVANNVLSHGVGGLNIDACRVPHGDEVDMQAQQRQQSEGGDSVTGAFGAGGLVGSPIPMYKPGGRFPANVLLDEHAAKEMDEQSGWQKDGTAVQRNRKNSEANPNGIYRSHVREAESDQTFGSGGGASRFFPVFKYQAKAPKKERPVIEREDGTKIQHNTVKPLALMEWLVSLIVPPGGTVLDPFAGSGTTLQAALSKDFTPIGIEQDADYIELIKKRLGLLAQQ